MIFKSWKREGVSIKKLIKTMNKITPFRYFFSSKTTKDFQNVSWIFQQAKIIKYKPKTSLESGLKITWNWFLKNQKHYKLRKNYFS